MGTRGPKPTPTAMLEKRGSWRGKTNKEEPLPERVPPPQPRGLTGVARKFWETYEPILFRLGVLTELDGIAFEQLCQIYADWDKYKKFLKKNGDLQEVRDRRGNVIDYKPHPYVKLKIKAQEQLNRMLASFGMTPADRSRIVVNLNNSKKGSDKIT